ncbi:MAG: hypothetical protein WBN61_06395, partial [Woeseiaceae bacterium]
MAWNTSCRIMRTLIGVHQTGAERHTGPSVFILANFGSRPEADTKSPAHGGVFVEAIQAFFLRRAN